MTGDDDQNSSEEKPIGYDHPLVDEDELDDSPVDGKYRGNWENIKDNPEAIVGFYKNYKNVPKDHRKDAIDKVKEANLDVTTDLLVISKSERKVSDGLIRAYSIAVLDSFADRILQDAEWIHSNVNRDQSVPIESYPEELGHTVFQMHVSTVSFVEASCFQILKYKIINGQLPDRESLLSWGSHEDRADLDRTKIDIESQEAEVFLWAAGSGVRDLSLALLQSGIIDDRMYERIDNIRNYRNDLVHHPATLTLKRFSDGGSILSRADDAIYICEKIREELNRIPKHPTYDSVVGK